MANNNDPNRLDPNKSLRELRDEQRYTEKQIEDEKLKRHQEYERRNRNRNPFNPRNYEEGSTPDEDRKPSQWVDPRNGQRGDDE